MIDTNMTRAYLIRVQDTHDRTPEECCVYFGRNAAKQDSPGGILQGTVTIVGAYPQDDLVLLGTTYSTVKNEHPYLEKFNHDDDGILGDVLVVRTDSNGDPIDI